jgi:hypothetical protein
MSVKEVSQLIDLMVDDAPDILGCVVLRDLRSRISLGHGGVERNDLREKWTGPGELQKGRIQR